jgi:DNA-damage-inducible protein J
LAKTDFIRVRVEPELKQQTEAVLHDLGISVSDAVTVFCRQVVLQRGLPFVVRIPNEETQKALAEDLSQAKRYDSVEGMFEDILSSDD